MIHVLLAALLNARVAADYTACPISVVGIIQREDGSAAMYVANDSSRPAYVKKVHIRVRPFGGGIFVDKYLTGSWYVGANAQAQIPLAGVNPAIEVSGIMDADC